MRLDALAQAKTQRLAAQRAGAVVGLVGRKVGFDLGGAELAEYHRRQIDEAIHEAARGVHHCDRAVELHRAAGLAAQLRPGGVDVSGLIEDPALAGGDLVGADDHTRGFAARHRFGLGQCQPLGALPRVFLPEGRFVDLGPAHGKGYPEARQQLAAIDGRGSEYEFRTACHLRPPVCCPWAKGLKLRRVFDLPPEPTYHTRPMPEGWSTPRDLAKLAELRAHFDYEIPLGELPGIPGEFAVADGPVRAKLQFGRERGLPRVQIGLQVTLTPICQRCLGAMRLEVSAEMRVVVVDSEAQAASVPEEFETFLAADGHSSLAALVAEELLLALPIVPRHAAGEHCQVADTGFVQPPLPGTPAGEETQRPFAELRALLERGRN